MKFHDPEFPARSIFKKKIKFNPVMVNNSTINELSFIYNAAYADRKGEQVSL